MNGKIFNSAYFTQGMICFSLLCMLFSLHAPAKLFADDSCPCANKPYGEHPCYNDEEAISRARLARILVGVTIVGLGAGVAYAVSGSTGKCHHHSSSSSYESSLSSNPSSSSSFHSSSSSNSHYSSDSYDSGYSEYFLNPNYRGNGAVGLGPEFAVRSRMLRKVSKDSSTEKSLSGTFHSNLATIGQGSVTAFVQLPDGTTQSLGHLPFSGSTSSSLAYGPFDQTGIYTFGIDVDEGTVLPMQTKVGSVHIEVNGSTIQSCDFIVPAHPIAHYQPPTFSYAL